MMTLVSFDGSRRKFVSSVLSQVLSPASLTMAHQLWAAEKPGRSAPQPEDVLLWVRLNMPVAAERIDELLHPAE
jgi:hypothetical protein